MAAGALYYNRVTGLAARLQADVDKDSWLKKCAGLQEKSLHTTR